MTLQPPPHHVELEENRLHYSGWNVLEAFVGAWLFLSPWILGHHDRSGFVWTSMILGAVVIVGSLASAAATSATTTVLVDRHHWWGWATIGIAVAVLVSPFVFGFWHATSALISDLLVAIVLAVIGLAITGTARRNIADSSERF